VMHLRARLALLTSVVVQAAAVMVVHFVLPLEARLLELLQVGTLIFLQVRVIREVIFLWNLATVLQDLEVRSASSLGLVSLAWVVHFRSWRHMQKMRRVVFLLTLDQVTVAEVERF
jgi:hypothetical protein